jgi:hypothetical protein
MKYVIRWLASLRREQYYIQKYLRNMLLSLLKKKLHTVKSSLWFYAEWRRSMESDVNSLENRVPWITFEACRFIKSILTPDFIVFEYGSGGSTLFFAENCQRVISVEHDVKWFDLVRSALAKKQVNNCDLQLILPEPTVISSGSFDDPECYADEDYKGYNFYRYVSSIDSFPDEFFDLVVVDGRARPSCVIHARPKIKIGGYLLLDDSERDSYQRAKGLLSGWDKHEFYGPGPYSTKFWETTIWKRRR